MTDRELMQQALEALNRSDYLGWQLNIPIIKALRERLAQPAQRPWVGLTEWEREAIAVECGAMSADWLVFMEAVERALKEKNT